MKSPIVGPAYQARSPNLANQRSINLFLEIVETKTGKEPAALFGCPGLVFQVAVGTGPIRGVHAVNQTTLYVVSGANLYAVTTAFSATLLGQLQTTSGPVSIIDNGSQVAISDGQAIYVWSGGMFTTPVLPSLNGPGTLVYQDTVGVYNELGTQNLWQSDIYDLTSWPALDNDVADGSEDNIVGLADTHRQIIVIKQKNTEYWINAGNPGFVFQRLEGVYPNTGCVAPASICRVGEQVMWLGRNEVGQGQVLLASSYEPQRVSTYAIESTISGYSEIGDAVGFGTLVEGHLTYMLNFPSGGETWCYDLGVSAQLGIPDWHQRAGFGNGDFTNYEPVCATQFNRYTIVGSGAGPNIYSLDMNTYLDNGQPRKALRSWRGVAAPDQRRSRRFNFLELSSETGIGVPPGTNPQWVLRYSDDSHTWSQELFAAAGRSGEVAQQVRWNRLGMCPRGSTYDRTFELSTTDQMKIAIFGADLD